MLLYVLLHRTHDGDDFLGVFTSQEDLHEGAKRFWEQKLQEALDIHDGDAERAENWVKRNYAPLDALQMLPGLWNTKSVEMEFSL